MIRKFKILLIIIPVTVMAFAGLSVAKPQNHGQKVSDVAKSTEPGPEHGKIVSEAARDKSQNSHALSFDGVDDFVNIPDIEIPSDITIEAWIKTSDFSEGDNEIVAWTTSRNEIYYKFAVWGGKIMLGTRGAWNSNTIHNWWQSNTTLDSDWHHVVVTQSGMETPKFYIDGVNAGVSIAPFSGNGGSKPQGIPLSIGAAGGCANYCIDYFFNGQIDEVRIWSKALTQEEIQANMYKEINPQEGLVGYWKFNEGSGDIAYDSSGNGNHGTLVNGPTWTTDTPF